MLPSPCTGAVVAAGLGVQSWHITGAPLTTGPVRCLGSRSSQVNATAASHRVTALQPGESQARRRDAEELACTRASSAAGGGSAAGGPSACTSAESSAVGSLAASPWPRLALACQAACCWRIASAPQHDPSDSSVCRLMQSPELVLAARRWSLGTLRSTRARDEDARATWPHSAKAMMRQDCRSACTQAALLQIPGSPAKRLGTEAGCCWGSAQSACPQSGRQGELLQAM